jgi:chromosome segregation ATPase
MKIRHKTHGHSTDTTDPRWAERVEREAERITDATQARYEKLQERLARVEQRITKEQGHRKPDQKLLGRLQLALDARRDELANLHRQMNATPAGSQNRGNPSHRGISRGEII